MTDDDFNIGKIETDISEFDIQNMIKFYLIRRFNKRLGLKLAMLYLKSTKGAKQSLVDIGLIPEEIEEEYTELKNLLGELH